MGEGVNISNLPEDHPMRNYGPEVYNNGQGIKSLADMQVLDYICLNVGRRADNMLYQFDTTDPDHPKFIGVQGINNDVSFGLHVDDKDIASTDPLTKLKNLCVISKSVFDAIMDIDEDTLRLSLKRQAFQKPEIDAACIRLQKLKEKVLEDIDYFKDKEPGQLEQGRIRIVSDEEFNKLTIDKILEVSPEAKLFKQVKEQVMNGVPFVDNESKRKSESQEKKINEITNGTEKKPIKLDVSEVNLSSKNYYAKIQRDLATCLLEANNADSVLRGSSKEYKAVQKALKDSIELLGKIDDNPKPEVIEQVKESLGNVTKATKAYANHKKEVHSGSEYEKKRISVMSKIATSINGKKNALEAESKKHISKLENDARRAENKAERIKVQKEETKEQIKQFVKDLKEWSTPEMGCDLKKTLAAIIVAGGRTEHAMKQFGTAASKSMFQMTKDQFDKQVNDFIETPHFQTYYNNIVCNDIDQRKAQLQIFHEKAMEHFTQDFRNKVIEINVNAQPQQQSQPQQPQQEQNRENQHENNIIANM